MYVCVYLGLVSQPCQLLCQQGTKSHPALVQLLRCLGNVISPTPLWGKGWGEEGWADREREGAVTHTYRVIHASQFTWARLVSLWGTNINTHAPCTQNLLNVICRRGEASHQYSAQNVSGKRFICLPTEHTHTLWCKWPIQWERKTPVPGKWKPPRGSRREKSMLKLYKDGFSLLPLKGLTEPHWLDDNWTWKSSIPALVSHLAFKQGSRVPLLPVMLPQLCSIYVCMSRIWLMGLLQITIA